MVQHSRSLRVAAGLVTGLLTLIGTTTAAPAARADAPAASPARAPSTVGVADRRDDTRAASTEDDAPLALTIDALDPGVLPRTGPVTISGTITNTDDVAWNEIHLYPYLNTDDCRADGTCGGPMTTVEELVEAADSDPETPVGERITDLEIRDTVTELAPGATMTFGLTIPQRVLRQEIGDPEPGVYWFGVHASGYSEDTPRDDFADGRARTFLPYVPTGKEAPAGTVDAAVVLPLRAPITHRADGSLTRTKRWERRLSADGYLGRMLGFGEAADGRTVSWLVDPAVLDTVRKLANGNVPRQLLPDVPEDDGEGDGGESESPTDEETTEEPEVDLDTAPGVDGLPNAQPWLDRAQPALTGEEILTLPYGDPDLSGAGTATADLYAAARDQQGDVLSAWNAATTPAVAGPDGYLAPDVFAELSDEPVALLTDRMFGQQEYPDGAPATGEVDGAAVAVTSSAAASGGPGPNDRQTAVALRQRLLSEAALRLVEDDLAPDPVLLEIPATVSADDADEFWDGLDQPWLSLTGVGPVVAGERTAIDADSLTYPDEQAAQEQQPSLYGEAELLTRSGATLQSILGEDSTVGGEVTREALAGTSFELRGDDRATTRLSVSRARIDRRLGSVEISAPPGVTLSSSSGRFSVTISNDLEYIVQVQVVADGDSGVEIDAGDPIVLGADSRTSVSLEVHTTRPGVHDVRLELTDIEGEPLGSSDTVPVRSGQVSIVIWGIIGAGVAILFVAIAIRLIKRIRRARASRR
ncbi:DUF6049 family protein [Nocardioides sambongensis]|uniref:DUF6049 family protein n=1 Tax=Nocardioides sambongensis TaxID=2589074 RepID=UPI00112CFB8D|nr:DUF6049 family protein [Nocardioides sambongensis]